MDITEAQFSWIMGCLFLVLLIIGYLCVLTAVKLLRQEQVLGRLYWHLRTFLDTRSDKR